MIETLYGRIFEMDAAACSIIMECAGVGYHVTVTANTLSHLPSPKLSADGIECVGGTVRIFTHMAVKEDGVELYGFYSSEELTMFRLLISVSGIGPKAAMSVLSLFTPKGLCSAITSDDAKGISRAPGIGSKTAARITLELKDKIKKTFPEYCTLTKSDGDDVVPVVQSAGGKLDDARDALAVLGYSRSEIAAAMKNIDVSLPLEDIIKNALSALMKN